MLLEEVLRALRSVPAENQDKLRDDVMHYFPMMADLLWGCQSKLVEFFDYYIQPAERDGSHSEDELPLDPELNLLLEHGVQMNELLRHMFTRLQKPAASN